MLGLSRVFILACSELTRSNNSTVLPVGNGGIKAQRSTLMALSSSFFPGPAIHLSPSYRLNKALGYVSPRTQSHNTCILVYLLSTKMEVVGRSGRLEGDLILPLDHWGFGVPRDGKYYPTPDRPVHTSPHTDTHMHGGNKYFPYQSAPSLIPQVGSLQRGGVKCSVFQGFQERAAGERKGQTLSPFAG